MSKDRVRPGDFERRVKFDAKAAAQHDERAGIAPIVDLAAHRKAKATDAALDELRRIDASAMLRVAEDFERQAAPHPEIKTRLVTRLAALLRALAAEQT